MDNRTSAITDPHTYSGLTVKASNIAGTRVMNRKYEDLGRIEELVIDVISGRIAYLILSFGGFLGMGEQHYAVPWKALTYEKALNVYVLNTSQDQIENSPGFKREIWPKLVDEVLGRQVREHPNFPSANGT